MADEHNLGLENEDWDEVFKHPAVTTVTHWALKNSAIVHDDDADERIRKNLKKNGTRLKKIIDQAAGVI